MAAAPLHVRPATDRDARTLADLNRTVHDLHVARAPEHFSRPNATEVAAWFASQLGTPTVRAWIAEAHGRPVGYALAVLVDRPANPFHPARRFYELDQIAVAPDHRRRGVARALLDALLAAADDDGVRDVELTTWCFNEDAQRAFERLGFTSRTIRYGRR